MASDGKQAGNLPRVEAPTPTIPREQTPGNRYQEAAERAGAPSGLWPADPVRKQPFGPERLRPANAPVPRYDQQYPTKGG